MANDAGRALAQNENSQGWRVASRRRWPFYASGAVIGVLMFAYFDGGEEPIRPIVQEITLAGEGE